MHVPSRYARKKFLFVTSIILFSLLFPTFFTIFANNHLKSIPIYKPQKSGISITFSETSESIDLEYFLPCAIMGQLSIQDNEELLKSFTILMRTYIYNMSENKKSISVDALSIPYMTYDEMEALWKNDFSDYLNKLNKLVCETSNLVITCDNALIHPYYHECSNGKTRIGREAYLKSVDCTEDMQYENFTETSVFSLETFEKTFKTLNSDFSLSADTPLQNLHITEENGYVTNIQFGENVIEVSQFIKAFELQSQSFQIDEFNGGIRIVSLGKGHGYGVSLAKARELCKQGASYSDVINYFYQNIAIETYQN